MKNKVLGYSALGIAFIVLSVILFVIPIERTTAFWIAYGFTVVAFGIQIVLWKTALGREKTMKSKFLGFPLVHIGIWYLLLQVVVTSFLSFGLSHFNLLSKQVSVHINSPFLV